MRTRGSWTHVVLVFTVIAGIEVAGCSASASKGTMPPPGPNGRVDASSGPDFIAVVGRDGGTAGYARKQDAMGPGAGPIVVYADDLRTVVGQLAPGKGFIPVGVDPATVPEIPAVVGPGEQMPTSNAAIVAFYVRNDTPSEIYNAVMVGAQVTGGGGFWGLNMGVGCYQIPVGSRLVLLDRSATEPGASAVREIYVRGNEARAPSLWIVVGKDGSIEQGTGVPAWWGSSPTC